MASVAHTTSKRRNRKPTAANSQKKGLDKKPGTELIGFTDRF